MGNGFHLRPLAGRQTIHQIVHDGLRPRHSTRPQLHRLGEDALANEVEKAATLVTYAVENLGETEKTLGLLMLGLQLAYSGWE